MSSSQQSGFEVKTGADVFSPKAMLELVRPGAGIPNPDGDLVLIPASRFSFEDKETHKFLYVASISDLSIQPVEIVLPKSGGDAFWLDSRTLGQVIKPESKDVHELVALPITFTLSTSSTPASIFANHTLASTIASFPEMSEPSNFKYHAASKMLVFSSYVFQDGDIKNIRSQDDAYNARGDSALVYDYTFVRHWDTWRGPKRSQLFSVSLGRDEHAKWAMGAEIFSPLKGTGHFTPVEPFGGADDFDVSATHIVYTAKDPSVPPAWHTRQNIYLVPTKGGKSPKELTSGKQDATRNPVLSNAGDKVAWLELEDDGYESDRAKIIIYDLNKDIRFTVADDWDLSPGAVAFSPDDSVLYLTVGETARVKIFAVPVPPTPSRRSSRTRRNSFVPIALTQEHAVSSMSVIKSSPKDIKGKSKEVNPTAGPSGQTVLGSPIKEVVDEKGKGRIVFSMSSFTGPNNVWLLDGLDQLTEAHFNATLLIGGEVDSGDESSSSTDSKKSRKSKSSDKSKDAKKSKSKDAKSKSSKSKDAKDKKSKDKEASKSSKGSSFWFRKSPEPSKPSLPLTLTQVTHMGEKELEPYKLDTGEEFWFTGAGNKKVQGWIIKPKGFKKGRKKSHPALLLIHGGPQGAWEDQWSTRWNPNVFAQQGYFVVCVNPAGSTTFGQDFTDSITEDWGGKPFVDLSKGWKEALKAYPEIDPERTGAAGASWGGFAVNWIQGHPDLGFGFKALVSHDGVFDTTHMGFTTDEMFFTDHEFGGVTWEGQGKKIAEKFNPARFLDKWSTPMLLIHGSKDYRLPETEGIGAFHVLQRRSVPSRLVIFPDENHFVLKPGNSLKWHYEVFKWLDAYLNK